MKNLDSKQKVNVSKDGRWLKMMKLYDRSIHLYIHCCCIEIDKDSYKFISFLLFFLLFFVLNFLVLSSYEEEHMSMFRNLFRNFMCYHVIYDWFLNHFNLILARNFIEQLQVNRYVLIFNVYSFACTFYQLTKFHWSSFKMNVNAT